MTGVGDPNLGLAPPPGYGLEPGFEMGDMDLNLMAYGFGDEFMAMGYGMGLDNGGGWAFWLKESCEKGEEEEGGGGWVTLVCFRVWERAREGDEFFDLVLFAHFSSGTTNSGGCRLQTDVDDEDWTLTSNYLDSLDFTTNNQRAACFGYWDMGITALNWKHAVTALLAHRWWILHGMRVSIASKRMD
jgi:hypothetical protein